MKARSAGKHADTTEQQAHKHRHDDDAAASKQSSTTDLKVNLSWIKNVPMERVVLVAFVAFAVALVFAIRMLPAALPMTQDWADNQIRQGVSSQIAQQIDAQFPSLPAARRQAEIDKQTNEFISSRQAEFETSRTQLSDQYKHQLRYVGEDGKEYTYLGDLDSYFWLRYMRNILRHGNACDAVINGVCRDMAILAPVGGMGAYNPSLHVWAIWALYKVITPFNPNFPLPATSYLVPVIIGMLGVIPAFFIGRRLAGNVGGLFAAVIISLHPLLLSRSMGSDNDVWNVVLPLFVLWMAIEALEAKGTRSRIIFAALTGLFVGVHAATWEGWWFIYLIILLAFVGYVLFGIIQQLVRDRGLRSAKSLWNEQTQKSLTILVTFYIAAFIFLTLVGHGDGYFMRPLSAVSTGTTLDRAVGSDYWPNVLTTVAELNKASIKDAVGQMGGVWFFFLSLAGLLFLLLPRRNWSWRHYALFACGALISAWLINGDHSKFTVLGLLMLPIALILIAYLFDKEHDVDIAPSLIILLWFLASIYASYSGVRFILLLIPAFGIGVAVACGRAYEWLTAWLNSELPWHRYITNVVVFAIIAIVLIQPIRGARGTAAGFVPSIDDAWWDGLTKIQLESSPDAVINSWWDFGHWFKYVADRRVTADGVTQHTHAPRWLGLSLVTSNEDEAMGTLRMLVCGNDAFPEKDGWFGAYGRVLNVTNDSVRSEALVRELVLLDRKGAEMRLSREGFTDPQISSVLNVTHCDPPEDYFITSADMIGKAGVWAHFGLWNFTRSYIAQSAKTRPVSEAIPDITKRFNMTEVQAKQLYYAAQALGSEGEINQWVSPWPNYVTTSWSACANKTVTKNTTNAKGVSILENQTLIVCPLGVGVGQQDGATIAVDAVLIDPKQPNQTKIQLGFYRDGQRFGSNGDVVPARLVFAEPKSLREIALGNTSTGFGVLFDTQSQSVLLADPNLLTSMFTQLYYLDARYSDHFEKFYDRSGMSGRVLIWKVNWNPQKNATNSTSNVTASGAATGSSANIITRE